MKPSVVILAKNEENSLKKAIRSALELSDDILVIDDESDDKTAEVAKTRGARVVTHKLETFADQRNLAEKEAASNWILHLDADEELTPELIEEIRQLDESSYNAYFIRRRDLFWGKELQYGETWSAYAKGFIRLYKKGSGSWKGNVHEAFVTNAETRQLEYHINHRPHRTVADFLKDVNFYSSLRARELKNAGARASIFSLTVQPVAKFLYTYFVKLGFLDGPAGFVYSFMMSFHSFLVRAKLYQYTELSN